MEYRELGRSGVKVSAICLGTMTYGEQNTEADGHAQIDYALDRGITMFDAAEIHPVPPKPETQGRTESIIGSWLSLRKARDKVMLATKAIGRTKMNWLRRTALPGGKAAPSSLRRFREPQEAQHRLYRSLPASLA